MSDSLVIAPYQEADREQVVQLWRDTGLCHPDNNPYKDIDRKMADSPDLLLVAKYGAKVVGTVMVGYNGHRGWINYLGVLSDYQGHGIAKQLMQCAEAALAKLGCPKIQLQVRKTNLDVVAFYEAIGYSIEDLIYMEKRLEYDR